MTKLDDLYQAALKQAAPAKPKDKISEGRRYAREHGSAFHFEFEIQVGPYGANVEVYVEEKGPPSITVQIFDEHVQEALILDSSDYYEREMLKKTAEKLGLKRLSWSDSAWHKNRYNSAWERRVR